MNMFILILLSAFLSGPSYAAIEVYSGGKHFSSFEDYQNVDQPVTAMPVSNPAKEIKESAPVVLDPGQEKLSKISYNWAVDRVVVNFKQNWKNPKPRFIVGADELEYAIAQAMENQHEPTLLISDPKKLRIMSYHPTMDKTDRKSVV